MPRRWLALLGCLLLLAGQAVAPSALAQSPGGEPMLSSLSGDGGGKGMYPLFDPDVRHYAVGCAGGELTLALSTADAVASVRVAVAGRGERSVPPGRGVVVPLAGLAGDSDVVVTLANGAGASAAYTVHCLPDGFPNVVAAASRDASDVLFTAVVLEYIAIFDANGVPRFHRSMGSAGAVNSFKYHENGLHPYSYMRRVDDLTVRDGLNFSNFEAVVLDRNLQEVDVVRVVPPLRHTNWHDFLIKPNGNYVLMSYEPALRDLSAFRDHDGVPYGTAEGTRDSVIQEITPERELVFQWNSRDHMAIEDCTQHRFPDDYAHVNSLQIVAGDIVASFRGCSQVLRIDGTSGDVVWLLGRSNRDDGDWIAGGTPAPLRIVGDPYGEFCGQHSARLRPNGNLVLFDNGAHCQENPATGASVRAGGVFSRVVEYALDPGAGTATFVRHHSLHGTFNRLSEFLGHVEPLRNGNWLISWSREALYQPPVLLANASVTEVDPRTGRELSAMTFISRGTDRDIVRYTRVVPVPPDTLVPVPPRPRTATIELATGLNRVAWPGRDGVPVAEAVAAFDGAVSAVYFRDAASQRWFIWFPDAAGAGMNSLATLRFGASYLIAAGEAISRTVATGGPARAGAPN